MADNPPTRIPTKESFRVAGLTAKAGHPEFQTPRQAIVVGYWMEVTILLPAQAGWTKPALRQQCMGGTWPKSISSYHEPDT
ncbi:MAG TPA: hypothetical protein VMD27_00885 [Candidatus Aquilonibacter sp.]|nr:hypothetical protein [Candidatus Aquilonibacter sp.]